MPHKFTNDYNVLIHPRILKALEINSSTQNIAYGLDSHSQKASEYIKSIFGCKDASIHFLAGGTQTNMVMISSALRSYQGVISTTTGHINVHETAAIESSGHKIITVSGRDGKIYPEDIESTMDHYGDEHMVKPGMVYISNSTEIGTIYYKDELINLRKVCDKYNLYLYMDGARLGSALTSKDNNVDPSLLGQVCDAFYIGGTKNGLLFGEALVVVNKELQKDFRYIIKNKGAMLAKGYALGIQFEEAFKDGLYFDIAKSTNEIADYLKEKLNNIGFLTSKSPTNQIFVKFNNDIAEKIINRYSTELWDKGERESILRFVVSFITTREDVDELINYLITLL